VSEHHDERISRAIRAAAAQVAPITLADVLSRGPVDDPVDTTDDVVEGNGRAPEHLFRSESTEEPIMVMELERQDTTERTDLRRGRRFPGWLATAAALLIAVAGATVLWAAGDDDTTVEVAPADAEPSAAASPTARVDGFLTIYNRGDWEAIQAAIAQDMDERTTNVEHRQVKQIDRAYVAANDRWVRVGECSTSGSEVVCPIARRDDFHGAGGLSTTEEYVFAFDEDGRLARLNLSDADPWAEQHAFRAEFRRWVEQERPDVSIQFFPPADRAIAELGDLPRADDMAAALELVDDFVAQSVRWG